MNWYYVEAGQQRGPVPDAEFEALMQRGTVAPDTLVWCEGMANWAPCRQVKPASAAPGATEAPPVIGAPAAFPIGVSAGGILCCECGQSFALDQVIRYGDRYVCATCKPVFLQRLAEGAPLGTVGGTQVNEQQLLEREYKVEIGSAVERAWNLFTSNAGTIIGASLLLTALVFVLAFGVMVVLGVLGASVGAATGPSGMAIAIVLMGYLAIALVGLFLAGPLVGGYSWFYLRLLRKEAVGVGDAFAGFRRKFWQLSLCYIVMWFISFACSMLANIPIFIAGGTSTLIRGGAMSGGPPIAVMLFSYAVNMGISAYLTTIWIYSLLLVIDKGYNFWPAMNLSRKMAHRGWWMTFAFILVAGILAGMGVLLCGIGLIVTIPLFFGMQACLFEDNFGDLALQEQFQKP